MLCSNDSRASKLRRSSDALSNYYVLLFKVRFIHDTCMASHVVKCTIIGMISHIIYIKLCVHFVQYIEIEIIVYKFI